MSRPMGKKTRPRGAAAERSYLRLVHQDVTTIPAVQRMIAMAEETAAILARKAQIADRYLDLVGGW